MGEVYSLTFFALFFDTRALMRCLGFEFVVDNGSGRGRLDHNIVFIVFIYAYRFLLRVKILVLFIVV